MNIEVRQSDVRSNSKLKIVDVDIHPKSSVEDLKPYLSQRWWDHLTTYGARQRQGYLKGFPYPKMQPMASRRDSWPPDGGLPASNLAFMKQQFLDAYPIEYAIMNPLSPTGQGDQNSEFSAAMAYAANEFQLDGWNKQDNRLLASVVVPFEDGDATKRRGQAPRRRQALRACAAQDPHQRSPRQEAILAGLRGRDRGRATRSASMCSAPAGGPRAAPAGRRSTSRT